MHCRPIVSADRAPLASLLSRTDAFQADEVAVAIELVDGCLDDADSGYEAIVAVDADPGAVLGYVCWGRTPMTAHTVDLYWMAVAPEARRAGVGRKLILAFEARLRQEGVRIIRVETSSSQPYAAAVAFYLREGYEMAGRIPDFYRDGDDLLILHRRLA